MLSVVDLGIVHRVEVGATDGAIRVEILPTFVGCPALELIKSAIATAARRVRSRRSRSPRPSRCPGRRSGSRPRPTRRCAAAGIAPPTPATRRGLRGHAHRPRAARPVPALRLAPDRPRERLRADPVPDDPLLRGLPSAVRSHQAGLTVAAQRAEPVELIGVVGAGTMGAGIAQLALEAGHEVLHPRRRRRRDRARSRPYPRRSRAPRRRGSTSIPSRPRTGSTAASRDCARRRRSTTLTRRRPRPRHRSGPRGPRRQAGDPADARRGDLVAEAILATNTSALSVEAIAARDRPSRGGSSACTSSTRPRSCRSSRSSSPPSTDPAVAERATRLDGRLGQGARPLPDTPGFIVNRVNRPFTLEALAMLGVG